MEYKWNEEYDRLLERAIAEGKVEPVLDNDEKRDSPRFKLSEGLYRSEESTHREINDLSKTGYAFYSERKYKIGEDVPLNIREAFEAHAKVVACEMVETDPSFLEFRYRVRCRFTNPEHGMTILLLLFEDITIDGEMQPSGS